MYVWLEDCYQRYHTAINAMLLMRYESSVMFELCLLFEQPSLALVRIKYRLNPALVQNHIIPYDLRVA